MLELKLPPADAYFKLKHVIEEVTPLSLLYRGTSPIRKRPPPEEPPRTLGLGLR